MTGRAIGANWDDVRIEGDPQLILGRRQGGREINAVVIDLHKDLFGELQGICDRTLQELIATEPRVYEPNAAVDRDDEHFVLDLDEIPEQPAPPPGRSRTPQRPSEGDNADRRAALIRTLRTPGQLEQMDARNLDNFKASFYSIAYQQPDGGWVHFIKKVNPRQLLKPGRVWTHFGSSLGKIEAPDMVIESNIDVVMAQERLGGFSANVIKNLFADVYLAFRDVPIYVDKIASSLGADMIIDDSSRGVLERAAAKKLSFASRLFALQLTLDNVDIKPDQVREVLTAHDIPHDQLLDEDGTFSFEEEAIGLFLDVLEGRYFEADWTGESRRADRFSTRVPS